MTEKTVAFPSIKTGEIVFHKVSSLDYLVEGVFKLKEPQKDCEVILPEEIDCMYIPGLVFSKTSNRIGYGKGYYDRYLKSYPGKKIGVCMKDFIIDDFNTESHDVKLDYIITD